MALHTLKGVTKIGNENVIVMDDLREKFPDKFNESGSMDYQWFEEHIRPENFIYVRHDKNSLSFTIQDGPIKEVGKNGCQVDEIIAAAQKIIYGLKAGKPCEFNDAALNHLQGALDSLEARRKDREQRGVEGTSKT